MIRSRIGRRSRTTIPQPVMRALGLREGDAVAYRIDGDKAVISNASGLSGDNPFGTFTEWDGEADRRAYGDL